jgi:hypothetical protein
MGGAEGQSTQPDVGDLSVTTAVPTLVLYCRSVHLSRPAAYRTVRHFDLDLQRTGAR